MPWFFQEASSLSRSKIVSLCQRVPHTDAENRWMLGSVPPDRIHAHGRRSGVTRLGILPADKVGEEMGGVVGWEVPVDLRRVRKGNTPP